MGVQSKIKQHLIIAEARHSAETTILWSIAGNLSNSILEEIKIQYFQNYFKLHCLMHTHLRANS